MAAPRPDRPSPRGPSVRRAAFALAGLLIGIAALRQFLRQPVRVVRRQSEDRDLGPGLAEDEAASPVGAELELEAARRGRGRGGAEGRVVAGHDRVRPWDGEAAEWITVLTAGQSAGGDRA